MKSVIIHSEAKRELDNAIGYYEKQKIGLGLDLLSEIEQALEMIQLNPNLRKPYTIEGLRRYVIMQNLKPRSGLLRSHMENVNPITGRSES